MSFTANIDEVVAANRNGLLASADSWKRTRLKDFATILNGYPFESARFSKDKGTPLIRIRDILPGKTETFYEGDFDPLFIVQPGEILVGMDGDFNCAPWSGVAALLNQRVCKITPDESRCSKDFLRYILPGYLNAINAETSSVTVKHLSSRTIADIPLPLPSIGNQQRIVAEIEKQFTRLEAGLAGLRRVQANLKRYRAAVLKAACEGEVVPNEVELAKAEGRKVETGAELLDRILSERRKKWTGRGKYKEPAPPDTSDLRQLPQGWKWVSVSQIGQTTTGFTPPKSNEASFGGSIPFFKPTDLDAGYYVRESREHLTPSGAEYGRLLPEGSVLVTCIGATIGKTGFARVDCSTNQQINALTVPTHLVSPEFVFLLFSSPFGQEQIKANASATTLPILNKSKFEALVFPLPPFAEQIRIVEEVESRLSVVDELETVVAANIQRATRLRQSILQRAFTGELA